MKFEITLRVTTPDGEIREREVIILDKGHDRHEETGLSIAEGKALLKSLQREIVTAQAEAYCASKSVCPGCGLRLRKKGSRAIRYCMVFGDISVTSQRYCQCACDGRRPNTFSPLNDLPPDHTAPELLWLETRWASLVSFGAATHLLKDVLPIGESLSAETVRNHLHMAAKRMEGELADEQFFFIETRPQERAAMPLPEDPSRSESMAARCARGTRNRRTSRSWSPSPCPWTSQTVTSVSCSPKTPGHGGGCTRS